MSGRPKKSASKGMKKPSVRLKKLIDGVAKGKTPPKAAKDAGFSESYARVDVYRTLANPSIQQRIAEKRVVLEAQADVERKEIIGTLAGHMRSDLADIDPDDELLSRAKESGVSHLIKKLRRKTRYYSNGPGKDPDKEVTYEFEMYSAQEAAKQLCAVFGLNKKEAENPVDLARRALEEAEGKYPEMGRAVLAKLAAEAYGVQESDLIQ